MNDETTDETIDETPGFTIIREFDATPHDLWQAWTDPDEAVEWWHPHGVHIPRESVTIDARVGGRYTYTMVNDATAEEYPTAGVYREVVEPERLVFTWGHPDDGDRAPVITVTIEPLGELTRMTFDLRGHAGVRGDGFIYDGWDQAFDLLARHLGQMEVAG